MAKTTLKQGICAYCGNFGEVTYDHIIPQCLWPGRVPKDSPQIPMPYRTLCKGTFWKRREARSGLALTPSRCTSLHKIRYGIQ